MKKLVPIVNGYCYSEKAQFKCDLNDGWWLCDFPFREFTKPTLCNILVEKPDLRMISDGETLAPFNFSNFNKKVTGKFEVFLLENAQIYDQLLFKVIRNRLFFLRKAQPVTVLMQLNQMLEAGEDISGEKGITPEAWMFIHRIRLRIAAAKELSLEETIQNSLEGLGKLEAIKELSNGNVDITWSRDNYRITSEISPTTLSVVRAGFCLNGEKDYTLNNLPAIIQGRTDLHLHRGNRL